MCQCPPLFYGIQRKRENKKNKKMVLRDFLKGRLFRLSGDGRVLADGRTATDGGWAEFGSDSAKLGERTDEQAEGATKIRSVLTNRRRARILAFPLSLL